MGMALGAWAWPRAQRDIHRMYLTYTLLFSDGERAVPAGPGEAGGERRTRGPLETRALRLRAPGLGRALGFFWAIDGFISTLFLAHKLKMFTGPHREGSPGYSLAVLV